MRVNIFSKEQIKDLQEEIKRYYELYDDIHDMKAAFDKDLKNIDAMTIDCIMLSLDSALREIRCLRKELEFEEDKSKIEASPEEIKEVLKEME